MGNKSMIKKILRRRKKVFVAGLPSSGSTYIYQIIRELGYRPQKIHHYTDKKGLKLVTFRDPRDMICSTANRQTKKNYPHLNQKERYKQAYQSLFVDQPNCQNILDNYSNRSDTLLIKYEDFFGGNELSLFKNILTFLNDNENEITLNNIIKKYSVEKNIERSNKLGSFEVYDKKTHLHGNHISNKGKIGYWKNELSEETIALVNKNLKEFMDIYGYD
jgi:hypothetical protein